MRLWKMSLMIILALICVPVWAAAPQLVPINKVSPAVRAQIQQFRRAPEDGGGALPDGFTVGSNHFSFSGTIIPKTTNWVPMAIMVAPPFEKVITAYPMRSLAALQVGERYRERNRHDDIVPLSILPETVSTAFTHGTSQTTSDSASSRVSVALTVGTKAGFEFMGVGVVEASVKQSVEESWEDAGGQSLTESITAGGVLSGWNWTLADLAKIFATQSSYDCYEYICDEFPTQPVWINAPVRNTARIFDLGSWNSYAQRTNDEAELLTDLPLFKPSDWWWIGNVEWYPTASETVYRTMVRTQGEDRTRLLFTGPGFYIDRQGNSLSGELSISSEEWQSTAHTIGTNTEFAVEALGAVIQTDFAVGQTYTHELAKGTSFSMLCQTSGVHPLLDGGPDSLLDFHFTMVPCMHRLISLPTAAALGDPRIKKDIARSVAHIAKRKGMTIAGFSIEQATGQQITFAPDKGVMVGAMPLADLMLDSDICPDHTGSYLVLQYSVTDLGPSYSKFNDLLILWMLLRDKEAVQLLREAAQPGVGMLRDLDLSHNLVTYWPPTSGASPFDQLNQVEWASPVAQQLAEWLNSSYLNVDPRQLYVNPELGRRIEQQVSFLQERLGEFQKIQLNPQIKEQLGAITHGFYGPNPLLFDPVKPRQPARSGPWQNLTVSPAFKEQVQSLLQPRGSR